MVLIAASREVAHSAGRSSRQAGLEVAVLLLLIWCWRVTRGGDLSRILGSALTLRLRPRWWLLLAALGSRLVITLTCLITVHYAVLPHCAPPSHPSAGGPAASCAGFGRGYPLPVWSTISGPHPALWPALARDGIQWVAVSLAALQAIWLWWNARPTYLAARRAAPSARPAA